jgi:hypothetical protein
MSMSSTKKVSKFIWVPVKLNYNITSLSEDESDKLIDPAGSLVKYIFTLLKVKPISPSGV